ncbi:MAG: NAD(P)/FAD-dependent oxidoreductase [Zoogloeaceae bacterium]|nr:NAD(P)/FAD-dependent oxidoreductase [Zoogloeaceae bacterium]
MERIDCLVVGAGVVGLAVARALAQAGWEVVVAERHDRIGTEISARNSEVIHAGLYYPAGSLKARLCVRGRGLLYDFCADHGVAHRRCGKLIVATSDAQVGALKLIVAAARANGVADVEVLDGAAARRLEPEVSCVAALLSPSTGIVDAHGLMLALLGDAESAGASLAVLSPIAELVPGPAGIAVRLEGEATPGLMAKWVINCGGLGAVALARRTVGLPETAIPAFRYAKGSYFALSGRAPFSRLIYPVPEPGGLGVHLTLDLAGQARFGPDVAWVDALDYTVDAARAPAFEQAVRAYWPGLPEGALAPAYAGIRPKISGPGEPAADFRIDGPAEHGIAGLINLFGIESPGLTASLAMGEEVVARVGA